MILQTERLVVRQLTLDDAAFALELLNEPAFIEFIGDKAVRTVEDARTYLRNGPMASYVRHGFGLWLVALKNDQTPIGICGPIRRDTLEHVDLGYALLARFCGQGYAHEAAAAVLSHARHTLQLGPILAITSLENPASISLLSKLGFRFERLIDLPGSSEPSRLFRSDP